MILIEYYEKHSEKQVAFIFFDAQKAFDNVYWHFILGQLKQTIGEAEYVRMIEAMYTEQKARFLINVELSESIDITKGTRQGCPLRPLLFILTMEVLNCNIRKDKRIKGIKIKDQEYKLLAFHDDLAVVLEEPEECFESLKNVIEDYGEVAGMKINLSKTKILTKNMKEPQMEELKRISGIEIETKLNI